MTDGTRFCARADLVAAHQECTDAEDGYQFLVMHRHMIDGLKQAFPGHTSLFEAFPRFPFDATDVPLQWRDRFGTGWAPQVIETAKLLEDIENNLDQFPTEGDLGKYMQCGPMSNGATAVHGALHGKWNVNGSPAQLGSSQSNVNNYMFWKLHGWIDRIWERYRVARDLTRSEPKLQQALIEQCLEMHNLGHVMEEFAGDGGADAGPLPEEHGFFHETVRPILEKNCSGCHGPSNPEGRLSLGGHISSANVVANLVGVTTTRGGQFRRVVAGKPDESWLYLKSAGLAADAGCEGTCNAQVMPPTGQVTLTDSQLGVIRQWILEGAPGPTQ